MELTTSQTLALYAIAFQEPCSFGKEKESVHPKREMFSFRKLLIMEYQLGGYFQDIMEFEL